MKVKSALKKSFIKRTQAIELILKKPAAKFKMEDFHQLRVEIKKIKAQFNLLNYCTSDFERKKYLKSYNSIFKQAGKVRELQLEEEALKKYALYQGLKRYITNLKIIGKEEKKIFFLNIDKKLFSKFIKTNKKVSAFIKEVKKKNVNRFMNKKRKKIQMLLNIKHLKLSQVHKLRKLVKEYYHDWQSLNLPGQQKMMNEVDDFQDLLGKWHDRIIIKEHLKKAMKDMDKIAPFETRQLNEIITKLSSECNELFRKINTGIHKKKALQSFISASF